MLKFTALGAYGAPAYTVDFPSCLASAQNTDIGCDILRPRSPSILYPCTYEEKQRRIDVKRTGPHVVTLFKLENPNEFDGCDRDLSFSAPEVAAGADKGQQVR
jgi:hypothetical protein